MLIGTTAAALRDLVKIAAEPRLHYLVPSLT